MGKLTHSLSPPSSGREACVGARDAADSARPTPSHLEGTWAPSALPLLVFHHFCASGYRVCTPDQPPVFPSNVQGNTVTDADVSKIIPTDWISFRCMSQAAAVERATFMCPPPCLHSVGWPLPPTAAEGDRWCLVTRTTLPAWEAQSPGRG